MTAGRLLIAAFAVAIVLGPFVAPPYSIVLFGYIGIATLTELGLVLLTGVAGQVSFGQSAFVGIGAYATACLTTMLPLSPWVALPLSLVAAALAALVIGGAIISRSRRSLGVSASRSSSPT
jgi:ABC-type branched-subunit amino acid transport system permease subunit